VGCLLLNQGDFMEKIEVIEKAAEVINKGSFGAFFQVLAGLAIVYFLYDSFKKKGVLDKIKEKIDKI